MVTNRRYRMLADFEKVSRFLDDNYDPETLNSYLLRPFFEYAHTHPFFDQESSPRFGLWEDGEELVGVACYEMVPGECFLSVREDYGHLLPEMLEYSERELSAISDGKRTLCVWITDKEEEKSQLLLENGYEKVYTEPVTIFPYEKDFVEADLPTGYSLISLEDENDLEKINECLWKGFDHGPDPDDDNEGRLFMQSGPNFRKDLTTIIKAPDGKYACYAGMWLNEQNGYAYLEPLATVPEHRGKGLATMALTEAMKKTKELGAKYCFGGVVDFYNSIGFEPVCVREKWQKVLD